MNVRDYTDPDLELAVLGAVLIAPDLLDALADLAADDFHDPRVRAAVAQLRTGGPIEASPRWRAMGDWTFFGDALAACWLPCERHVIRAAAGRLANLARKRAEILANGAAIEATWRKAEREALNYTDRARSRARVTDPAQTRPLIIDPRAA